MLQPPDEVVTGTTTEKLLWALLVAQHGDVGALRVWENLYGKEWGEDHS